MSRLHPEESRTWAHCVIRISTVYLHTFLICLFFFTASILFSNRDLRVAEDNFDATFFEQRKDFINSSVVMLDELIEALNPSHPLNRLHKRAYIRYSFGSTFLNHCNVVPYPIGINFPSLLRKLSFFADSQACLRAATLIAITVRLFCCFCRCADIQTQGQSRALWILCIIYLISELSTSVFGMLLTAVHAENDEKLNFLVYNSLIIYGISFLISASLYTFLENFDNSKQRTWLRSRVFCILVFGFCFPEVLSNYSSFLIYKPCMVYVSWYIAVREYACMVAIVTFYLTQWEDYRKLELVISTERVETMGFWLMNHTDSYTPAMLEALRRKQHQLIGQNQFRNVIFVW
ncbi:unnamed protein product [Caenorhabditis bovis]|uniref:Uncharacterized protein n=1 Tax=Caenorhabditis bovis TaxID=2654633 RepID=A0A8S1EZ75_9PELO|nr:unnamed protein product [Caenorhabditis bovis]